MRIVLWGVICMACAVGGQPVLGLLGALVLAVCLQQRLRASRSRQGLAPTKAHHRHP